MRLRWKELQELPSGTIVICAEDHGLGAVVEIKGRKIVKWDDGCVTAVSSWAERTPKAFSAIATNRDEDRP